MPFDTCYRFSWLSCLNPAAVPCPPALAVGAVVYDGMPHGSTLSDSTALLAVKLAETDTRESIDTLKKNFIS